MKVKRGIVIALVAVGVVLAIVALAANLSDLERLKNDIVSEGEFVAFRSLQISIATSFLSAIQWALGWVVLDFLFSLVNKRYSPSMLGYATGVFCVISFKYFTAQILSVLLVRMSLDNVAMVDVQLIYTVCWQVFVTLLLIAINVCCIKKYLRREETI